MTTDSVTAFAPATVGNVGIGFDILGHTVEALGDRVTARRTAEARRAHHRDHRQWSVDLPLQAEKNTAGMALLAMAGALALPFGFEVAIDKGIPLGSGLGGSAASAVAAVVAANALLDEPLTQARTAEVRHAGRGGRERLGARRQHRAVAVRRPGADGRHRPSARQADPGAGGDPLRAGASAHVPVDARGARASCSKTVDLSDVVWQTANLAGFLSGCYTNDLAMIRDSFEDVIIEPQRSQLIPGFEAVKQAALANGALGCSISGAGPTIFAWCEERDAEGSPRRHGRGLRRARPGEPTSWISAIDTEGARVVER